MPTTVSGFHGGELLVQRRAGVERDAARLVGMLAPPVPGGGWTTFLAGREFAVLTARAGDGRLWVAPLLGRAGFLHVSGTTLSVDALPHPAGPLASLPPDQDVGLIAMEFNPARRLRVNGRLSAVGPTGMSIEAAQVFGNCPAHIQHRTLTAPAERSPDAAAGSRAVELNPAQRALTEGADTFFLGTIHPEGGADASHKGGRPGFVRVEAGEVSWPDYAGNNMFNSLGNLAENDEAALLFLDFEVGSALHVSGRAALEWVDGSDRRVRLAVERVTQHALPLVGALT